MAQQTMRLLFIALVATLGLGWGSLQADNEMVVALVQQPAGFTAEIHGEVAGLTQARMLKDGETDWINFDVFDDEFELTGDFADLAELNSAMAGQYTVEFTHATGTTTYSMTVDTAQQSWFTQVPQLDAVPAVIPQQYNFAWAWDDSAMIKSIDAWGDDGEGFELYLQWMNDDPGFASLSYEVDFVDYVGEGFFAVLYGSLEENLVTAWMLDSGDDLFDGASPMAFTGSSDSSSFTVIPEPGTALLLLLGSAVGLLRRR